MMPTDLEEFMKWYEELNPGDEIDMGEAMLVYFNQETYEEVI